MKYSGRVFKQDSELSVEREGIRLGSRFLDYAEIKAIRPISHRVYIDTLSEEQIEISMLGFSYDGFLKDLIDCYSDRSMEALFARETAIMRCEGEYQLPEEQGRGTVILLPDAICVLPMTCRAIRIPLCFTKELRLDGYLLHITMLSGAHYTVGRMGYDTIPFAERAQKAADRTKKQRAQAIAQLKLQPPYTRCGIFRTEQPQLYWFAALGKGRCAVELFTGDDCATYLYRFTESEAEFLRNLDEAMEAMGINREIIYLTEEQLAQKPLYRMAVARMEAVRFLRGKSDGRLIHSATHSQRLKEFLSE
ncbi:MAG: hypothetical protein IJJ15_06120 [Ruminococcus sp.]|nr:hypothetical protein [Ruminococcus sp.]